MSSKVKQEIAKYALELIAEYEKYRHDDYQRPRLSAQLHVLEIISIRMGWNDLDEKITNWRAACESQSSK